MAVSQMKQNGIPASITMAQALLESGAGGSELARKANNHFGIKCGSSWYGETYTHFDDGRNECFRKYSNVEDSYADHSKFLKRERYSRLFSLDKKDYQNWARGLKACGYATSPTYADRLISIIELYELYKLDEGEKQAPKPRKQTQTEASSIRVLSTNNGITCAIARDGDTWDSLAKELDISKKKLLKYNEADASIRLTTGDYIYLGKKAKKGDKKYKDYWHRIQQGESMYSISQKYGIQLASLYKLNYRATDYKPMEGDLLKVR